MTASSAEITPGSGLKLATNSYTEAAVTVHSQNMIYGEQYLPTYIVSDGDYSVATANSHPLQIMAGASLRVRVRRIEIYQSALATTVTNMSLQISRLTTAGTGGTAITPAPLDPADAAAGATAMALPTVKGTEGTRMGVYFMYMMQTLGASAVLPQPGFVIDFDRPRSKPLIIPAGATNGIAIKNITAVAAATIRYVVFLDETSW